MFKHPKQLIQQYLNLPPQVPPPTEEDFMSNTINELERKQFRRIPSSIIEFHITDNSGIYPHSEKSYNMLGQLTSVFHFKAHETKYLQELYNFDDDNLLTEFAFRYLRGELEFANFIYNKNKQLNTILTTDLSNAAHCHSKKTLNYNQDNLLAEILDYDYTLYNVIEKEVFTYNNKNLLQQKQSFNSENKPNGQINYLYNSLDLLEEEIINENHKFTYDYNESNQLISKKITKNGLTFEIEIYKYFNEYLIEKVQQEFNSNGICARKKEWKVDLQNKLISETNYKNEIFFSSVKIEYDNYWLPKKGIQKYNNDETELRFEVSLHPY